MLAALDFAEPRRSFASLTVSSAPTWITHPSREPWDWADAKVSIGEGPEVSTTTAGEGLTAAAIVAGAAASLLSLTRCTAGEESTAGSTVGAFVICIAEETGVGAGAASA